MVAVDEDHVVGHILFSTATVERQGSTLPGKGPAPMDVLSEYQRRGIGSMLVGHSLEILRASVCPL